MTIARLARLQPGQPEQRRQRLHDCIVFTIARRHEGTKARRHDRNDCIVCIICIICTIARRHEGTTATGAVGVGDGCRCWWMAAIAIGATATIASSSRLRDCNRGNQNNDGNDCTTSTIASSARPQRLARMTRPQRLHDGNDCTIASSASSASSRPQRLPVTGAVGDGDDCV